jgi:hypothetical protein
MPWWGWVLIVVGVAAIGYLKVNVWTKMTKKKPNKNQKDED